MGKPVLLIVLGSADQRPIINTCLRGAPYRLVFAADGEDGFDRFREVQPDIVLSHLKTARLDGTILCHLIVQESQGAVGVVLFGDEPFARGASHAEAVGARAYVPIDNLPERLVPVLARALEEPAPKPRERDPSGAVALPPSLPFSPTDNDPFAAVTNLGYGLDEENSADEDIKTSEHKAPLFEVLQEVRVERPSEPPLVREARETRDGREVRETTSELHASMLEEMPLPYAGMGAPMPIGSNETANRRADEMFQELPREATPSASEAAPRGGSGAQGGGQRKGLDESQLGKRLVRRVHQVHQLLDTLDYYQLLGVERNATPAQLRSAYFELSLEFHPDRFFLLRSGDTKAKIYAIFRRVSEAYAVLSDERRRAMYNDQGEATIEAATQRPVSIAPPKIDLRISAQEIKLDGVTTNPGARRFLQLANVALKTEDLDTARLMLSLAVGLDPQNTSLRRVLEGIAKRRSKAVRAKWGVASAP